MSKAKNCPKCNRFFNPKFSGKEWENTFICTDCYLREQLKIDTANTAFRKIAATPNQGI